MGVICRSGTINGYNSEGATSTCWIDGSDPVQSCTTVFHAGMKSPYCQPTASSSITPPPPPDACVAVPPANHGSDFFGFLQNILDQDFTPILQMVTTISYLIGLFLIIAGLGRLHRHGQGSQMYHRVSPMGTAMYFVSGAVLISFMPYLQMLSNSLFAISVQDALMTQCASPCLNGFHTSSNAFCPMNAYSLNINTLKATGDIGGAIKYGVFALMFLIGVISFIRGMLQLIKLGEGHQGGGIGKAFTFIFAGIVAVNMSSVYTLFQNILGSNLGS